MGTEGSCARRGFGDSRSGRIEKGERKGMSVVGVCRLAVVGLGDLRLMVGGAGYGETPCWKCPG